MPRKAFRYFFPVLILAFSYQVIKGNNPSWPGLFGYSNQSQFVEFVVDFTFDPNEECADIPIQFTNLTTGDGLNYSWNFGDGSAVSTQRNPTHTFSNAIGTGIQTYTVTLTVTDENGDSKSASRQVTVKKIPSLAVGSDQESTDFENLPYFIYCDNESVEFTFYNQASADEDNILYEIEWGDNSAGFSGADWTELKHTYSMGIYTLTYSVTPANGCKVSKSYGVFIGSNPAVGFGNPGNTNICVGDELTFPITGTDNNPDGTRYIVSFNDGSEDQIFNHPPPEFVTHAFSNASCGIEGEAGFPNSFKATILAVNPCSRSQATVVPIYVTEPATPVFSAPEGLVCIDKPIAIKNSTVFNNEVLNNGNCATTGKFVWDISPNTGWELSNGNLGTRPNPTNPNSWVNGTNDFNIIFTEPGTYTIKLLTGNRCGINEAEKEIVVIPEPEALFGFNEDEDEFCSPALVEVINMSNFLDQVSENDNSVFTWSVSYARGACGTTSDWSFQEGSSTTSINPKFEFKNPGIYTIRLSARTQCGSFTYDKAVTIKEPPTVSINNIPDTCGATEISPTANVISCSSSENEYKWTFEGGVPNTSTELDPGTISFSSPGEKTITLEVTNDCGTTKQTKTITISEPPIVNAGEDLEVCAGREVILEGEVTGGSGNFRYQWNATPAVAISGANTLSPKLTPNQNTVLTLTVTDNVTGCIVSDALDIKVIPATVLTFELPNQEVCSGSITEAVDIISSNPDQIPKWTAEANGVTGVLENGSGSIPAQTLVNETNAPIDVVYTAFLEEGESPQCPAVPIKYTIRVLPTPSFPSDDLIVCSEELVSYRPTGSTAGTLFTWTVDEIVGITGSSNSTTPQPRIEQTLTNDTNTPLTIIYTVIPQQGGCLGSPFELAVTVQPAPSLEFSIPEQSICTGTMTEEVALSSDVSGAGFSWTVDPKGLQGVIQSGTNNLIPAQTIVNPFTEAITLDYRVVVNSSEGSSCSGIPRTYRITVFPEIAIKADISAFNGYEISCKGANDGFIKLSVSGGGGSYEYSWSGPGGFLSENDEISGLIPGSYTVSISNIFGCVKEETYEINEPDELTISLNSAKDILCAGDDAGFIEVTAQGGIDSKPYTYSWTLDGKTLPISGSVQNTLKAGIYAITVMDANGCSSTLDNIEISEPDEVLEISHQKTDISCYGANDGSLSLSIAGGVPPYDVRWNNGSRQLSFTDAAPGVYFATITDQIGCVKTETVIIEDAPLFAISPEVKNISCFGLKNGSIKLNLQGGVGQTTITWSHGDDRPELFNLTEGQYTVIIKDQTDCDITSVFNIVEPAPLILEPRVSDALDCFVPASGNIILGISGGVPPYVYTWSNGSNSSELENIPAGRYAVTVTDASGCEVNDVFEVKRPPALSLSLINSSQISCEPREIVQEYDLGISGGVAPFDISWSGGEISNNGRTMKTTESGLYSVTVVDGQGCSKTETFNIESFEIIPDIGIQSFAFDQYSSYLVNFEIQFQNKSFGNISSYFWDFGDGTTSFEENPKHTYTHEGTYQISLTVTDIFGCPLSISKEISVFDYFLVVPNAFTPNGDGINDYIYPKFINIEELEFWILNKWGETIFYSDDLLSQGWDGKMNDQYATPGNYVYRVKFRTLDGRVQTKTDLFMLIR